jgi:hypothetical protein
MASIIYFQTARKPGKAADFGLQPQKKKPVSRLFLDLAHLLT